MFSDFKIKSRSCFTSATSDDKNTKFIAFNHDTIQLNKDAYRGGKKVKHHITLMRPLVAGWSGAPYKQGQKGVKTQKLSEMVNHATAGMAVKMFAFEKSSTNMEKGPRCDDMHFDRAGNVLPFWLDDKRIDEVKRTVGQMEQIDAFSVLEIHVAPRNNDGASKGTGCKITEIHVRPFTLYSCIQDIEKFPATLADARSTQLLAQQANACIAQDLQTEQAVFHMFSSPNAFIQDEEEGGADDVVRIVNTGVDPIDIPIHALLAYTNCTRKDWACSLLEMAIANNALQLLVVNNDFWKNATHSPMRAVPLINTEILLRSIVPMLEGGEQITVFPTHNTTTIDDVVYRINIHVDKDPISVKTGPHPNSVDFVLAGKDAELEKGYKISFNLVRECFIHTCVCFTLITTIHAQVSDDDDIPNYWVGYFDVSPRRLVTTAGGFKRRRPTPCDDE